jgi:hypothetical protein
MSREFKTLRQLLGGSNLKGFDVDLTLVFHWHVNK